MSDLHLEGFKYKYEYAGEDVLVLAGDIHTKSRHNEFLETIDPSVKILLVAGNHEYYHSEFHSTNDNLKRLEKAYNVWFLNNSSIELDGVSFFGGTMFTDFELYGVHEQWFAENDAKRGIADFGCITVYDSAGDLWDWNTRDHKEQYIKFNKAFDRWVKDSEGKKRVAISHFMPSPLSIHPKYKNSNINPYFTANNEARVQKVDLWLHGHTHDAFDYKLGDTRVVCNPRGYCRPGYNENADFKDDLIITL